MSGNDERGAPRCPCWSTSMRVLDKYWCLHHGRKPLGWILSEEYVDKSDEVFLDDNSYSLLLIKDFYYVDPNRPLGRVRCKVCGKEPPKALYDRVEKYYKYALKHGKFNLE